MKPCRFGFVTETDMYYSHTNIPAKTVEIIECYKPLQTSTQSLQPSDRAVVSYGSERTSVNPEDMSAVTFKYTLAKRL